MTGICMALAQMMDAFYTDSLEAVGRRRDDINLATARQRDGAAQDNRTVGAAIVTAVLQSDDPAQYAGINAGVRVPTTLDHPGNPVVRTP